MVVCAWCKAVVRDDGRREAASHGICDVCLPRVELEMIRQAQARSLALGGS
ncbi:MAG: hypothetical protein IT304_07710 [Dehalococcoidia bacterium]|nr:hypothetical protein [Dehalococcoidia bacterium]